MNYYQGDRKYVLPDEIKIFDIIYKINYLDRALDDEGVYSRGRIHYISGTMSISIKDYQSKERPYSLIWRTIWHEVMHVIRDAYARSTFPSDPETLCNLIATGVNTVCFDNNLNFSEN